MAQLPNYTATPTATMNTSQQESTRKVRTNHTTIINTIKKELLIFANQPLSADTPLNQEIIIYISRLQIPGVKKLSLNENVFKLLMAAFKKYPSKVIKSKQYRYKNKTLVAFDDMIHFCYEKGLEISYDYELSPSPNQSLPNCLTLTKPNKTSINIYEFEFKVFYNDVKFINTTVVNCNGIIIHFDKIKQVNGTISHEIRLVSSHATIKENIDTIIQVLRTVIKIIKN